MGDRATELKVENRLLPALYPCFEAAAEACGEGYSDAALNAVRLHKAASIIDALVNEKQNVLIPNAIEVITIFQSVYESINSTLKVLDFGGGYALTHYVVRRFVTWQQQWAIVESPLVAAMGRAFEYDKLRYFDRLDTACRWLGGVDVIHSDAALQYLPHPEGALEHLLSLGARCVAIFRVPLTKGERKIQIQESMLSDQYAWPLPEPIRDRVIRYPHTSINADEFKMIYTKYGYSIDASTPDVEFSDNIAELHQSHFLLRR